MYGVIMIRRLLLRLVLGKRTYEYMQRTLAADRRLRTAYTVDIVIRKDGRERRLEADWTKALATIVLGPWKPGPFSLLPTEVPPNPTPNSTPPPPAAA